MVLSNAERQRAWRERHKGKPWGNRVLLERLAELEAVASTPPVAGPAASAGIRLLAELPEYPNDWTDDEEIINAVIGRLTDRNAVFDDELRPLLVCLPDLLERAAPQFIDACRHQVALNEQAAAAKQAKRKRASSRRAVQP
jgi:hypothetical protein